MINNFRRLVQSKLNTIENLQSGEIVGDDLIEENVYYFGYRITTSGINYNLDYSNKKEIITLTGYLSTKNSTLSKFDEFTDSILNKLSELRILATATDISTLDTKVRKVMIVGSVNYDYLDGLLK